MTKFVVSTLTHGVVLKSKQLDDGKFRINLIIPSKVARVCDLYGDDLQPRLEKDKVVLRHTVSNVESHVAYIMNNFIRADIC